MEHVFIVVDTMPNGIPGYSIVGAYRDYEEAHSAARAVGTTKCLVQQTTLK